MRGIEGGTWKTLSEMYAAIVNGKTIILIDDVCTSGATLEACAAVLKEKGAKKVSGFTLAREIYDRR